MLDRRRFVAAASATFLLPASLRAADTDAIVGKIMVEDRRLWIAAAIGNGKPLLFVIDTGAGFSYIRPEIARDLGLQIAGNQILGGLGKNRVLGTTYLAHDVLFGNGIRQSTVAFAGYDFQRGLPPDAAGLLPASLFTGRDSDVDFQTGEWRLWPHGRPDRPDAATEIGKLVNDGRDGRFSERLYVNAAIDGQTYRLILDTGAPNDLLLLPRAAQRSGPFKDEIPFAPEPTSGFGGRSAKISRRVRASRFQLGPLVLDRPLVTLMDPAQNSNIEHDGLIGLPLIRLLTLSTGAQGGRLWAVRNGLPPEPDRYRIAGLWLDKAASGRATVTLVGTGSPASRAGIRKGDEISDPPSFEQAIARIGGPPGREVSLGLDRDGQSIPVRYTLADYL